MSQEQNKKTLRHFQCRDYLWEVFEQMSNELECSPDYLINEAMRQYARSRNYGTKSSSGTASKPEAVRPAKDPVAPPSTSAGQTAAPPAMPKPGAPPPLSKPKLPPSQEFAKTGAYPAASPSMMAQPGAAPGAYPKTASSAGTASAPSLRPSTPSAPPPFPRGSSSGGVPAPGGSGAAQPPLYIQFNGERYTVTKDEFIIGRSSKTADLAIKDGNVSRRHAAIMFRGGRYVITDLGSTNGIEYGGERIESRQIEEGDVVVICDYELRFSYR